MGNIWSGIWGSSTQCGLGHFDNCVDCGFLAPECCCKCSSGHLNQCFYLLGDVFMFLLVGVGVIYVSDALLGGEETVSMFDEMSSYMESSVKELYGIWKGMMGGIHGSLFNLFTSIGGTPSLCKLVAFTTTTALSLEGFTFFESLAAKYATTCVGQIFAFINTPITFLKSTIFQSLGNAAGQILDIVIFPFELVIALVSIIIFAIWKAINSVLGICSKGTCCGGESSSEEKEEAKNDRASNPRRCCGVGTPPQP